MLRGWDGTGIAGVKEVKGPKPHSTVAYHKRSLNFIDYLATKGASKLLEDFQEYYYILGHVRASTVGNTKDMNAHPFQYGDITLIHNGTVDRTLLNTKTDETVDSAHIASYMAEHGELAALEKLDGGYSLVWYNQNDDSLNFARNDRKPMAIAFIADKNELFYGSEYHMLWATLGRNQMRIDGDIRIPTPLVHYKFNKEDLRKFTQTPFKEYARPTFIHPSGVHQHWRGNSNYQVVVHSPQTNTNTSSTDTKTTADATAADTSNKSGSTDTTDQKKPEAGTTEESRFVAGGATKERQAFIAKVLEPYGLRYMSQIVVRAASYFPDASKERGRVGFSAYGKDDHKLDFCMCGVSKYRWERYMDAKKVACTVVQVWQDPKDPEQIRVYLEENKAAQSVIERDATYITQDDKVAQEVSKSSGESNGETKSVVVNTETGEILYTEPSIQHPDKIPHIKGPQGSIISKQEFMEYAKDGCGYCPNGIDISRPNDVSYFGDAMICADCTGDPAVQDDLNGGKKKTATN